MIQRQFMGSWVPTFKTQVNNQVSLQDESFVTFQLSTIGVDGFPKNRTVVYRGFLFDDETNNVLTITTDKRMNKYEELIHNDKFEAVFYLNKVKRQFRVKGYARIVDSDYKPIINLSNFKPRSIGIVEDDDDEEVQVAQEPVQEPHHNRQLEPISYNLISPSLQRQLCKDHNASMTSLNDLNVSHVNTVAPSPEEFEQELNRQWEALSKTMRKSFRKPVPGSKMTRETSKALDSIKRGVDGKKDIDGVKNFALVCLFVERVDYFDNENDKRYVFEKDAYDMWTEHEVCP